MAIKSKLRKYATFFKRETLTLYFAVRDPRTPLIAKIIAGLVVAYALSPIDLIPDFIPVLGYLDDLVVIPLGISLCLKLIPINVLLDARKRAEHLRTKPKKYLGAFIIVIVWLLVLTLLGVWLYRRFFSD